MNGAESTREQRALIIGAVSSLLLLFTLSIPLAVHRIIQVDEAQNVMMASILGRGLSESYFTSAPLMLIGPLAAIAASAASSAGLFTIFRLIFTLVLWLNITLIAKASGATIRSMRGLLLLLAAATLAPLWDYGFEIRHDNLLLTGILLLWFLLRVRRDQAWVFVAAGFVTVLMQFNAFKAFLYWAPILGITFLMPPPEGISRLRSVALVIGGGLAGFLTGWILHLSAGTWDLYVSDVVSAFRFSSEEVMRFPPWAILKRLAQQVPLALGVAGYGLYWLFQTVRRREGRALVSLNGPGPELMLALAGTVALLLNPTPYFYNLVLLLPPYFLLAARLWTSEGRGRKMPLIAVALIASGHLIPWFVATIRHSDYRNDHQVLYMDLAEVLTDENLHGVFDGAGLVPTRLPSGRHWLIHGFTIRRLSDGTWPPVREQLRENEVPVVFRNYRTDWLTRADHNFIKAHYVALKPDFLVLGTLAEGGQLHWEALATGRYEVSLTRPGKRLSSNAVELDGTAIPSGIVTISKGKHQFQFPEGTRLQIIWVGPHLNQAPAIPPTVRPLFVNWY